MRVASRHTPSLLLSQTLVAALALGTALPGSAQNVLEEVIGCLSAVSAAAIRR